MRPQSYDIDDQCRRLKGAILRRHGTFSNMSLPSSELVEQQWEIFLEKFVKDPGMLSRAVLKDYKVLVGYQRSAFAVTFE